MDVSVQTHESNVECDDVLNDPCRLDVLKKTRLMGSKDEEAFDRLTRLASEILESPITIISLMSSEKIFFKSSYGLPEPWVTSREAPVGGSVCKHTLAGQPLLIEDAREVDFLRGFEVVSSLNIVGYLGVPMITKEGVNLGSFCVIDRKPRSWTDREVNILKELTNSAMSEIELRLAVNHLEIERDLRERFVSLLTHDLRTPLTAASLTAQMMARKELNHDEIQHETTKISVLIKRADQMIQNLLDRSLIRTGEFLPLRKEPHSLKSIVEAAVETASAIYGNRFEFSSDHDFKGFFNREGIQRVLENLLSNGIRYGDSSGIVKISLTQKSDKVEIAVHNNGGTLSSDEQKKLFEPFQRTESAWTSGQRGWGLGLALVKGMAEAHGGSARVVSDILSGTIFYVQLPLQ